MMKYIVSYDDDTVTVEGDNISEVLIKIIRYFELEDSILESLEEDGFMIREFSSIKNL